MHIKHIFLLAGVLLAGHAQAQSAMNTGGTVVMVPASAEVSHPNEVAIVRFMASGRNKSEAQAGSQANQNMKEGLAIIRATDPSAKIQTGSFESVAVRKKSDKDEDDDESAEVIGWEVSQEVTITTRNLSQLSFLGSALQGKLSLGEVRFELTPETMARLREKHIAATYASLNATVASVAKAMGKGLGDATLETITFDGADERGIDAYSAGVLSRLSKPQLTKPNFVPGETTLTMKLVGKVRFK